jgi:hypothetical protein
MKRAAFLALALALVACGPRSETSVPPSSQVAVDAAADFRRGFALLLADDPEGAASAFARSRRTESDPPVAAEARYWEAFARFRIGDRGSLEEARRLLAPLTFTGSRDPDPAELELRILSRLATGDDPGSAAALAERADSLITDCPAGDPYARTLALAGLLRAEPERGWRLLERALDGESCPPAIRHNALFVVPLASGSAGAALLARVAREDPDRSVRLDAALALQRFARRGGTDELLDLWDAADTRATKEQLILQYAALESPAGEAILRRIQASDPEREVRLFARAALLARWTGVVDRLLPL